MEEKEDLLGYAYSALLSIAEWPNQTDLDDPRENWEALRLSDMAAQAARRIERKLADRG